MLQWRLCCSKSGLKGNHIASGTRQRCDCVNPSQPQGLRLSQQCKGCFPLLPLINIQSKSWKMTTHSQGDAAALFLPLEIIVWMRRKNRGQPSVSHWGEKEPLLLFPCFSQWFPSAWWGNDCKSPRAISEGRVHCLHWNLCQSSAYRTSRGGMGESGLGEGSGVSRERTGAGGRAGGRAKWIGMERWRMGKRGPGDCQGLEHVCAFGSCDYKLNDLVRGSSINRHIFKIENCGSAAQILAFFSRSRILILQGCTLFPNPWHFPHLPSRSCTVAKVILEISGHAGHKFNVPFPRPFLELQQEQKPPHDIPLQSCRRGKSPISLCLSTQHCAALCTEIWTALSHLAEVLEVKVPF